MTERENELFEEWWENKGQYNRAGGGDYEKTFAYYAWMAVVNREGYKLVPVEPDLKMVEVASEEHVLNGASYKTMYKVMIGVVE